MSAGLSLGKVCAILKLSPCTYAEEHILPILASLDVLDGEEEEMVTDIEIGQQSLKFRKHHGKYRVVMVVGTDALEDRTCKFVDLLCGPSWSKLDKQKRC